MRLLKAPVIGPANGIFGALAALFVSILPLTASAGDIYKWTDAQGSVHFSSKPREGAEVPADLPSIQKENLDSRIELIKEQTPKSCVKHGGIDCKIGPDGDGSVVCIDGYRDAVQPFQFACLESRLRVDEITFIDLEGKPVSVKEKGLRGPFRLQVALRNLSDVAAAGVKVAVAPPGVKQESDAEGPSIVEPYAIGYYTAGLPGGRFTGSPGFLSRNRDEQAIKSSYRVSCTNCPGVMTGKKEVR